MFRPFHTLAGIFQLVLEDSIYHIVLSLLAIAPRWPTHNAESPGVKRPFGPQVFTSRDGCPAGSAWRTGGPRRGGGQSSGGGVRPDGVSQGRRSAYRGVSPEGVSQPPTKGGIFPIWSHVMAT